MLLKLDAYLYYFEINLNIKTLQTKSLKGLISEPEGKRYELLNNYLIL